MKSSEKVLPESPHASSAFVSIRISGLKSVFEGSAAAGTTYEILEQVAIDLPESGGLGHLGQVVHTELKAELFQVLNDKGKEDKLANTGSHVPPN